MIGIDPRWKSYLMVIFNFQIAVIKYLLFLDVCIMETEWTYALGIWVKKFCILIGWNVLCNGRIQSWKLNDLISYNWSMTSLSSLLMVTVYRMREERKRQIHWVFNMLVKHQYMAPLIRKALIICPIILNAKRDIQCI